MRIIGGKLVRLVFTIVVVTLLAFFLVDLLPGDPVQAFNVGANKAQLEEIRRDLQLDDPVPVRYARWLGNFVTGDMGSYYSVAGDTPFEKVKNDLPVSLQLMLYTQILALLVAIPLGVLTAYRANTLFDRTSNFMLFVFLSVPAFVVAFLLKKYLALEWDLVPESGWVSIGEGGLVAHFKTAVMPVVCLALAQIAVYQRLLRSDMISTLQEDFITMAKAKGLKPRRVLFRHALRPSSLTLLTVAGLNVGTLIGGAVIIERIFRIPGIGTDTVEALLAREYVALQSFIAIIGLLYVTVNFLVDFLYTVLDPRIRHA